MATDIGRVEFLVGADGRILERELRRVGKRAGAKAGADTGKQFTKAFDGELSDMGTRVLATWRGKMTREGKNSGLLFADGWGKAALNRISGRAKAAMSQIAEAFVFEGDWDKWAKGFDSVTDAIGKMEQNLRIARREGGLTDAQFEKLVERNKEYGASALQVEDAERRVLQSRKAIRDETEKLNAILGNRDVFAQHIRDLGSLDNAYNDLNDRLVAVDRSGENSSAWMIRARGRLNGLALSFGEVDTAMEKNEKTSARHGRLIRSHVGRTIAAWTMLVLAIGEGTATLGSGVGATITALIGSLGLGLVGALGLAGTAFTGFIAMAGAAINSMRFMRDQVPAVARAMDALAAAAETAGKRFADAWGPSVARFLEAITALISNTNIADALAASLSGITDAFTNALNSPGFQLFYEALATTIPNALLGLGSGMANFASGLAAIFAGAAPALQAFADLFNEWTGNFATKMAEMAADGRLTDFFMRALDAMNAVFGLVGALSGALLTLFEAAAPAGNALLGHLTDLANRWNEWMQSIEGQTALQDWFATGQVIFMGLLDLAGDLGLALASLVTPDSVARLIDFMDRLGEFLPIGAQILEFFGRLDVLNIFVGALNAIGEVLAPLMPHLLELATLIGEQLVGHIEELAPLFADLGAKMAPVLEKLVDLAVMILPPLLDIIVGVIDVITAWMDVFSALDETTRNNSDAFVTWQSIVGGVFAFIGGVITTFLTIASGGLRVLAALIRGDFSGAFKIMEDIVRGVFRSLGLDFDKFTSWVQGLYAAAKPTLDKVSGAFQTFGSVVKGIISGISSAISGLIGWFNSLFGAANKAAGAARGAASAGSGGGGGGGGMASGGILNGPRRILAGEAGPEAIVPLNRALSAVDPSVRWLSAIAQGKVPSMASGGTVTPGKTINFNEGAIAVIGVDDSRATANDVVTRIVERVGG